MRTHIYNSTIALIVFITLVIFVPYDVSFFAFKVSDIWLMLCLYLQYANGFYYKINYHSRSFLKNFGLYMGALAIIGTVFQAWHDDTSIIPGYFSEFYRFFRY